MIILYGPESPWSQQTLSVSEKGLLSQGTFWENEGEAPLLNRNAGFLKPTGNASLYQRLAKWPALAGVDLSAEASVSAEPQATDEALRIFLRDAERTFTSPANRQSMVSLLRKIWPENCDYAQSLGYICSFLMLTFDEDDVLKILLKFSRDGKYLPGYWKATPDNYVRDAMVYWRLAEKHHPEVFEHVKNAGLVPEAYASKWIAGLCVHVLPFEALFDFVEAYLEQGHIFVFRFAMSVLQHTSAMLLECKSTAVDRMFEILRLDPAVFPNDYQDGAFFTSIVQGAFKWDLTWDEITTLRAEEMEKLQAKLAKAKQREAELKAEESDDEIVFSDESEEEDPEERLRKMAAGH